MPPKQIPPTPLIKNKKRNECITQPSPDNESGDSSRSHSRRRGNGVEINDPLMEFKKAIMQLKEEQGRKLDELQTSINAIRQQNADIIESIEFLSNEYKDLKNQVDNLEIEGKNNLKYIQTLENKIVSLETSQKLSCLEIKNIPTKHKESKQDLLNTIIKVGDALNLMVETNTIKDVYRINTKAESNKPIIVEFTSVIAKEKLIEHCKKFNQQHRDNKFNTSHLHINGPQKNIYISEHLTSGSRRLFFLARDFANTNEFKFCWTAGGKIFLRKKEGERHIRINSETDLNNLKVQHNV